MLEKTFELNCLPDRLSDLLADLQNHIDVTLTLDGVPLAKVLPLLPAEPKTADSEPSQTTPKAGLNRGSMVMSEDFDEPLPDSFWGL